MNRLLGEVVERIRGNDIQKIKTSVKHGDPGIRSIDTIPGYEDASRSSMRSSCIPSPL
mgnify:CR=1 FL=1